VSESFPIPSPDNPIEVTIVVNADGYVSSSTQLYIASPGVSAHAIELANFNTPPVGVESNSSSGGSVSTAGGTSSDVIAGSSSDATSSSATISIPQGTILKGSNGEALSGTVETRVTYFDPQEEQSLNSFPGGFSVNTGTERGNFITAGFSAIDMTVGGAKVEEFGSEVEIGIDVPVDLKKPDGSTIQPGDKIPLWSYDEETGEWTQEGEVTVPSGLAKTADSKSVYKVKATINHLSYWNLDWFQNSCPLGVKINITGGCFSYLGLKAKFTDREGYLYSGYVYGDDRTVQLRYVPKDIPVNIVLWDYTTQSEVGSMVIDNLCQDGTIDIAVINNSGMEEVSAKATAVCHNSDGTVKSRFYPNNYPIYYKKSNAFNWNYLGMVINGEISSCLEVPAEYTFGTYLDGKWVQYDYMVEQTNFEFEFSDLDPEYGDEMRDFCN
ncbi:MAG: hypothetical protein PF445_01625, partial [Melioribacteraceae bacterium]|nr:hypothetical protein [Melioribacteraceae bacterium]